MTDGLAMQGKVCLVTGATSGIGLETALELARQGADVVLVGRNKQRGEAARHKVTKEGESENVKYFQADLSSREQVHALVRQFKAHFSRLDVLVNNAGTVILRRRVNSEGQEMTLAINHLGHFLLTNLLEDVLNASAPARVINVSSASHRGARINFEDLHSVKNYNGMRAYGQSKLANVLFTYELDRRWNSEAITVNALHPGFVSTNLGRENGWLFHALARMVMLVGKSAENGAQTTNYLAISPQVDGVSGKYFKEKQEVRSSSLSYDIEVAKRLWEVSEELVDLHS